MILSQSKFDGGARVAYVFIGILLQFLIRVNYLVAEPEIGPNDLRTEIEALVTKTPLDRKLSSMIPSLLRDSSSTVRLAALDSLRDVAKMQISTLEKLEGSLSLESPRKWDAVIYLSTVTPLLEQMKNHDEYEIIRRSAHSLNILLSRLQELRDKRLKMLAQAQLAESLPAGPYPLAKISGACSSSAHTFFAAQSATTGRELWRFSDQVGKASLVKNIAPGAQDSLLNHFHCVALGNKIYFSTLNSQLWESDGTERGTRFLEEYQGKLLIYRFKNDLIIVENHQLGATIWRYDPTTMQRTLVISWPTYHAEIAVDSNEKTPYFVIFQISHDEIYGHRRAQFAFSQGLPNSTKELPRKWHDRRFSGVPETDIGLTESTDFLTFVGGRAVFRERNSSDKDTLLTYDYLSNDLVNIYQKGQFLEDHLGISDSFILLPLADEKTYNYRTFLKSGGNSTDTEEIDLFSKLDICSSFVVKNTGYLQREIYELLSIQNKFLISLSCQNGKSEHMVELLVSDGSIQNTKRLFPPSPPGGGLSVVPVRENYFTVAANDGRSCSYYSVKDMQSEMIFSGVSARAEDMRVVFSTKNFTYLALSEQAETLLFTDGTPSQTKTIAIIGESVRN